MINRGGGAALRTGYRLMSDAGATVVVTLDADGQHLPEEMSRLVRPVLDGDVDVAHGSRVLGHAEPNHYAREMGIVFFNRMVSFITRTKVSDCSNGYRAVRSAVLPPRPAAAARGVRHERAAPLGRVDTPPFGARATRSASRRR